MKQGDTVGAHQVAIGVVVLALPWRLLFRKTFSLLSAVTAAARKHRV